MLTSLEPKRNIFERVREKVTYILGLGTIILLQWCPLFHRVNDMYYKKPDSYLAPM